MIGAAALRCRKASHWAYADFILEHLSGLEGVSCRAMMGELYVRGKAVGGLYDDRLLVKQMHAALRLIPDAPRELPDPGAREMLLASCADDSAMLTRLVSAVKEEVIRT